MAKPRHAARDLEARPQWHLNTRYLASTLCVDLAQKEYVLGEIRLPRNYDVAWSTDASAGQFAFNGLLDT